MIIVNRLSIFRAPYAGTRKVEMEARQTLNFLHFAFV